MAKQLLTQEGYDLLLKRLEELRKEEKKNIVAIQDARGQGDLSENADYSAAREQQAKIAAEIKDVEYAIKNAEIITADDKDNLGKIVKVRFLADGEEESYKIVGSIEADPMEQRISTDCPLGKAILKAKKGDVCLVKTEDGERFEVKVLEIKKVEEKKKPATKTTTKKK